MLRVSKFILVVVFITTFITLTYSQNTMKILFKLSGRNLPSGKNSFAEVNKDLAFYCRTDSEESQNPSWPNICEVEHPTSNRIHVETRNDRSFFPDESIGWSYFETIDMLQVGNTLESDIANSGQVHGKMNVTVLVACVPGEPGCGLLLQQYLNTTLQSSSSQ